MVPFFINTKKNANTKKFIMRKKNLKTNSLKLPLIPYYFIDKLYSPPHLD